MIIDCIADTHGFFPKLEGGDLLIVAGDLTANDTEEEWLKFAKWIANQNYKHRIFIGGNHDNKLVDWNPAKYYQCDYLCDSGTEFEGLRIWGSPWTNTFPGMNPHCKAFTCETEEELAEKWALIPNDVDILITHSPPLYGLDKTTWFEHVGSESLQHWILTHKPLLHVFGHIHESYGKITHDEVKKLHLQLYGKSAEFLCQTTIVNASHVNENYEPVNKPIRIEL